jgi:hypothetical protein
MGSRSGDSLPGKAFSGKSRLGEAWFGTASGGTASFGKALSGNPRFALCGLALIYAAEFLWIIFPQPQRLGERNASRIKTYTSTDPVRPLGDRRLDSF